MVREGLAHHQRGALAEARKSYQAALESDPAHFDAQHLLGVLALQAGNPAEAAELIAAALQTRAALPFAADAHVNHGSALKALGRLDEAIQAYDRAIICRPHHAIAYFNRANVLRDLGRQDDAITGFQHVLTLKPDDGDAHFNLGLAQVDVGQFSAAVVSFENALRHNIRSAEIYEAYGRVLRTLGRLEEALASFEALALLRPGSAGSYGNRGVVLADLGREREALADYNRAIALDPRDASFYSNRGQVLRNAGDLEAAAADFALASTLNPKSVKALYNLGTLLSRLKRYSAACEAFASAAALDPNYPFLLGTWLHTRMMLCDWRNFSADLDILCRKIENGESTAPTFALCAMTDSLTLQRKAADIWVETHPLLSGPPLAAPLKSAKIRVGYFSSDFYMHPVMQLAAGLFETHDRSRFEIIAFSYGQKVNDPMRHRLEAAFDRFIDVSHRSDSDIAESARAADLDIAVDLVGYTGGARPGIFAHRAAPVQVSYLGYPATMGASFMDYLVADEVVIPAPARPFFSEKIIWLPTYQVNDRKPDISKLDFDRESLGLPPNGFVFACFNNPFKITPDIFAAWMRILRATPGSVLFISAEEVVSVNLRREASEHGVDPARIIVGKKVPTLEYWARLRAADLFLDTFPFNAHSTASDCLWAGLPVLTLKGESYASRVGASLLTAIGLPELIAVDLADYEAKAAALAKDPHGLAELKRRALSARSTAQLFDTSDFTKHIEEAFVLITKRSRAGKAPDHISVGR